MSELKQLSLGELLTRKFDPPGLIMEPWLPTEGICQLWGPRGGGKTLVTLGIGLAVASGWRFCDMRVPKPRKVLYVDGEMPIALVQDRLRKLVKGQGPYPKWAMENFVLLSHTMFDRGIPDLSKLGAGWRLIEREAEGFELIVLDNLSSLLRTGIENDAESWHEFNEWLLRLRRLGKTVLVIHHSGKPNSRGEYSQRGTSRREDQMDTSVQILTVSKNPLICSWTYTKHRSFQPDPERFELEVNFSGEPETGAAIRLCQSIDAEVEEVMALQAEGLSVRKIGDRLRMSKSKVQRLTKKS